jgi:hypothetical protein
MLRSQSKAPLLSRDSDLWCGVYNSSTRVCKWLLLKPLQHSKDALNSRGASCLDITQAFTAFSETLWSCARWRGQRSRGARRLESVLLV